MVDVGTCGHRDVSSPLTPGCGDNKGEERGVVLTTLLWVIDVCIETFRRRLYLVVGLKREMGGDVVLTALLRVVTWALPHRSERRGIWWC